MKTKTITQHTPGPWEVSTPFKGENFAVWTRNHTMFEGPLVISTELSQADACLIAAAPELLEYLKGVLSHPKHGQTFSAREKMELLQVIAKAEGR